MKNKIKLSSLSLLMAFTLIGCTESTTETSSSDGYFIDSAVAGVEYTTSSGIKDKTDQYGKFKYNIGDLIQFKIGKLILGEAEPNIDGLITPKSLVVDDRIAPNEEESQTITLLLRTLQSLDSDNNSSNGITIDENIISKLETLEQELNFEDLNESDIIDLDNQLDIGLDEDYDDHIDTDEDTARTHFENSKDDWDNGKKPDDRISGDQDSHGNQDNNDTITTPLSLDVKKSLAYMGNEERLAYDIYNKLGSLYPDVKQFINIATRSEIRHISAVQTLIKKYNITDTELSDEDFNSLDYQNIEISEMTPGVYGVADIQNLYDALLSEGTTSQESALFVGCKVEVTDINDLDKYITYAQNGNNNDVVTTFNNLREGSYNHYWAFDKALKTMGVTDGCYVVGDTLLSDKNGIYPQNTSGQGNSGNNQGNSGNNQGNSGNGGNGNR